MTKSTASQRESRITLHAADSRAPVCSLRSLGWKRLQLMLHVRPPHRLYLYRIVSLNK